MHRGAGQRSARWRRAVLLVRGGGRRRMIGSQARRGGAGAARRRGARRPAGRSTTSAAPSNSASRSRACWRGGLRRSRCERARRRTDGRSITSRPPSTAIRSSSSARRTRRCSTCCATGCGLTGSQGRLRHRRLRRLQRDAGRPAGLLLPGARRARPRAGEIETIEGMAKGEKLHPLQRKFLEHAALQCGICTPGFLVAAKALLEQQSRSDRGRDPLRPGRQPLPLHRLRQDRARRPGRRQRDEKGLSHATRHQLRSRHPQVQIAGPRGRS